MDWKELYGVQNDNAEKLADFLKHNGFGNKMSGGYKIIPEGIDSMSENVCRLRAKGIPEMIQNAELIYNHYKPGYRIFIYKGTRYGRHTLMREITDVLKSWGYIENDMKMANN